MEMARKQRLRKEAGAAKFGSSPRGCKKEVSAKKEHRSLPSLWKGACLYIKVKEGSQSGAILDKVIGTFD